MSVPHWGGHKRNFFLFNWNNFWSCLAKLRLLLCPVLWGQKGWEKFWERRSFGDTWNLCWVHKLLVQDYLYPLEYPKYEHVFLNLAFYPDRVYIWEIQQYFVFHSEKTTTNILAFRMDIQSSHVNARSLICSVLLGAGDTVTWTFDVTKTGRRQGAFLLKQTHKKQ